MFRITPVPAVSTATLTRIAIAGDTGTGQGSAIEATVQTMVDQARQRNYDGLVLLGDLIHPEGDADQAGSRGAGRLVHRNDGPGSIGRRGERFL